MAKKIVLGEYAKIAKVLETHPKASGKTLNRYLRIKRNPRTFVNIKVSLKGAKTVEQGFQNYVNMMRNRKIQTARNKMPKAAATTPKLSVTPNQIGKKRVENEQAQYGNRKPEPVNTQQPSPTTPHTGEPMSFFIITHPFGPNPFEAKKESKGFNYFAAVMILVSIVALVVLAMYVFPPGTRFH